jgi:uncharacterized membrane protein
MHTQGGLQWRRVLVWGLGMVLWAATAARAEFTTIYGAAPYDQASTHGYMPKQDQIHVNNSGTAVGTFDFTSTGPSIYGTCVLRWDSSGQAPEQLGFLTDNGDGFVKIQIGGINSSGAIAGQSWDYVNLSNPGAPRAATWQPGSTAAHAMMEPTGAGASPFSTATAISDTGIIAGTTSIAPASGATAVRWNAAGQPTRLDNLSIGDASTRSTPTAVNDSGTVVGYSWPQRGGTHLGCRAVRWDANSTAATELGNLGADMYGHPTSYVYDINNAGTCVGYSAKQNATVQWGTRAVRWEAGTTVPTELGGLPGSPLRLWGAEACAINEAGLAVGYASKYVDGEYRGTRATCWRPGQTAATELFSGLPDSDVLSNSRALAVSDTGLVVGYNAWEGYTPAGTYDCRALLWTPDGQPVNLNSWIDPASGWTLTQATTISPNGQWIGGLGRFQPAGADSAYAAYWTMQVPEPGTLAFLALAGTALLTKRRR